MEKYSWLIALLGVFISSCAQLLMKASAVKKKQSSILEKFLNIRIMTAYSMMMLSSLISVLCLRHLQLQYVPMIEATGFLWVPLLSFLILREKPTRYNVIGGIIIVSGMILFTIGSF